MKIIIVTDGSCNYKNRAGAWCCVPLVADSPTNIIDHGILIGAEVDTTINRCELYPILAGLRYIDVFKNKYIELEDPEIVVISDSETTIKSLYKGAISTGTNADLWKMARELTKGKNIRYIWRPRNSTNLLDFCDGIANTTYKCLKMMLNMSNSTPSYDFINYDLEQLNTELGIWEL